MPKMNNDKSSESKDSGLSVPSHESQSEIKKPEIDKGEGKVESNIKTPIAPKDGIEVVATREGFFNQHRIKRGQSFKVSKVEQLGDWMSCKDPSMEKERVKRIEQKKKANR